MRSLQDELRRSDPHSGMMEIFVISAEDFLALTFSSHPRNIAIVRCIAQWLAEALAAKPPPLCATCDHKLADVREVKAFIVGRSAFAQETGHMLVSGVCTECGKREPAGLLDAYCSGLTKIGLAREKLQQGSA